MTWLMNVWYRFCLALEPSCDSCGVKFEELYSDGIGLLMCDRCHRDDIEYHRKAKERKKQIYERLGLYNGPRHTEGSGLGDSQG